MAFSTCHTVVPPLQATFREDLDHQVACHLYAAHQPELAPTTEQIATNYQRLAQEVVS
jgi:hypothetical protein